MLFSKVFYTDLNFSAITSINDFVRLFAMSVKGSTVCMYSTLAFLAATVVSACAKFMKY